MTSDLPSSRGEEADVESVGQIFPIWRLDTFDVNHGNDLIVDNLI